MRSRRAFRSTGCATHSRFLAMPESVSNSDIILVRLYGRGRRMFSSLGRRSLS
ncbi:hypothetical protein PAHAL_5G475900 [Panicum hallii]|uniref:Uncharacterized protein n=1 Tax=Panicum hallii TaxID=206008 RepID=A0A2T8INR8_9POAL|nr:hypothetical protein PAHAL_5G475900 [Panicum hallii]